jgi:large subunit ribosomal protein L23
VRRDSIMEPYEVILYPLMTEAASLMVEKENKLVFRVSLKATKSDVKSSVEELYEVKVQKVNLQITPRGEKKAFVKLHPDYKAADVAIKLGIL